MCNQVSAPAALLISFGQISATRTVFYLAHRPLFDPDASVAANGSWLMFAAAESRKAQNKHQS